MKLNNTSASQVQAWTACPRAWHFRWVRGFKEPPTLAQQRGTLIHSLAENVVVSRGAALESQDFQKNLDGKWNNPHAPYALALLEHVPYREERILAERKFMLDTAPGLPPWMGFIDLIDDTRTRRQNLSIGDYKTTSDLRYAKTPAELQEDPQMTSYGRYIYDAGHDEPEVDVGHFYVHVKSDGPPKRSLPKTLPVFTTITPEIIAVSWDRDLLKVEAMVRAAEHDKTDTLEPLGTSNGQCSKYGGCPHRARCGITSQPFSFKSKTPTSPQTPKDPTKMNFLDTLKAKAKTNGVTPGTAAAPAPATKTTNPAPAAAAKPAASGFLGALKKAEAGAGATQTGFQGVLAPDAAPRVTSTEKIPDKAPDTAPQTDENGDDIDHAEPTGASEVGAAAEAAREEAAAKKKGRPAGSKNKPKTEDEPKTDAYLEGTAKRGTVGAAPNTRPATRAGFALYIDCYPAKELGREQMPVLFEDWIAPLRAALNERVMEASNLPDYRLLAYAQEKVAISEAVHGAMAQGMPAALVVSASSPGARDVLDVLIPHATLVVRPLKS